jgi:hypothetical protein
MIIEPAISVRLPVTRHRLLSAADKCAAILRGDKIVHDVEWLDEIHYKDVLDNDGPVARGTCRYCGYEFTMLMNVGIISFQATDGSFYSYSTESEDDVYIRFAMPEKLPPGFVACIRNV